MNKFFSWKKILLIVLIGIGIWVFIPKIVGLKETIEVLKNVSFWTLLLALLAESFFYLGSTILTQTVLKMTKDRLGFYDVLKISIMDSFSVQFLPLGSFGEAAVDYYFYKAKGIRISHIVLMFISRTLIIWLVFAFIYLVGVAFTPINRAISPDKLLILWLIYFLALAVFGYFVYLYYRKPSLVRRALQLSRAANFVSRILHLPKIPEVRIPQSVDKIYEATAILASNRKLQIYAILGALLYWFGDIFCLYFAFLGFGWLPNITTVIFAYAVAKILSTLSFIPGGLGVMEATLGLIFVGFGVPAPIAFSAVLVFRFLSFWLPIPLGLWSFLILQKNYFKMKLNGLISG